jgi:anti-sigma B factor antagonist
MKITARDNGTCMIAALEGSLDNESLHEFEQFLKQTLAQHKHLLLDLSRLSFIMSSGLSTILSFNNSLHQCGLLCIIFGITEEMEKLFSHTGIASHLTICETLEEAIEKIAKAQCSSTDEQP